MDLKLKHKTAFVTGSTAGIGFAIAQRLAGEGANVIVNGRSAERVEAARQRILSHLRGTSFRESHTSAVTPPGGTSSRESQSSPPSPSSPTIQGLAADLGTAAGCEAAVRQYPQVDILVNNLGIFEPKPFEQISDADWLRFFEVNVLSGVRLSRAYLSGMKERNWGRIIFISSESAVQIPAEMIHYGMTKTAQVSIARGLAETCAGTAVTVNSVLPGPTASEGVSVFVAALAKEQGVSTAEFEKEFFRSVRPTSLLKRFIRPDEVASVVAFACSPEASAINGAALRVEGGIVKAAL